MGQATLCHLLIDPRGLGLGRSRIAFAAADGLFGGALLPFASQTHQDRIRGLLGKGAEGGPLAADQAQNREVQAIARLNRVDAMVAADLAGTLAASFVLARRQWAHPGKGEDNLRPFNFDLREDTFDHAQEVVDLVVGATGVIRVFDAQIRGAYQHPLFQRADQHNPAVAVFKEKFMLANRLPQFRVIQNQM